MDFDRLRATNLILLQTTVNCTPGSRLAFADLQAAQGFEHWLVDSLAWEMFDPTGSVSNFPLGYFSGLFLCPPNTPAPTLDGSRLGTIFLPLDSGGLFNFGSNVASGVSANCTKEIVVPPQWFIRAICNTRVGQPFGAGAQLQVSATFVRERQCGQDQQ